MKLWIADGKLRCKTLFSNKEINAQEIDSIVVKKDETRIHFKDGRKDLVAKNKLNILFEDGAYFINNNVSYEDITEDIEGFSSNKIAGMLEKTRNSAKLIASKVVKEQLGQDYDIDVEVVGKEYYSILVFRLVERGQILYEHPSYEEIGELGVDKAIDAMDLSFLIKCAIQDLKLLKP